MVTAASGTPCAVAVRPGATTGVGGCELWVHRRLNVIAGDVVVLTGEPSLLIVRVASSVLPCLVRAGAYFEYSGGGSRGVVLGASGETRGVGLLARGRQRSYGVFAIGRSSARRTQRRRVVPANYFTFA